MLMSVAIRLNSVSYSCWLDYGYRSQLYAPWHKESQRHATVLFISITWSFFFLFFFKVGSELGARFGRLVNECLVRESWSQSKFMSSHQLNLMCNSVPANEVVTFPAQRQGKHGCLEIASGVFFSSAFSQSIATFQGSSLKNCSRKLQHLRLCASSQDKNKANHSRSRILTG